MSKRNFFVRGANLENLLSDVLFEPPAAAPLRQREARDLEILFLNHFSVLVPSR